MRSMQFFLVRSLLNHLTQLSKVPIVVNSQQQLREERRRLVTIFEIK